MRSELTEAGIGLLVIVAGAIFVAGAFYESEEQEAEGYRISITVSNAAGLIEGSNVRLAGIDVGEVSAMALLPQSYSAEVILDIDEDVKLPTDTSARILPTGLVGHSYVELEIGGDDEILQDGDVITFAQGSVNVLDLVGRQIFSSIKDRDDLR